MLSWKIDLVNWPLCPLGVTYQYNLCWMLEQNLLLDPLYILLMCHVVTIKTSLPSLFFLQNMRSLFYETFYFKYTVCLYGFLKLAYGNINFTNGSINTSKGWSRIWYLVSSVNIRRMQRDGHALPYRIYSLIFLRTYRYLLN